jgi:hypothetical protein
VVINAAAKRDLLKLSLIILIFPVVLNGFS